MKTNKKILIITYYWPPAGGPGVQRWLKFVKYLPDFGYKPIVYIPENPSYPILDENLLEEVPKDVQIIREKIKEPYQLAQFFASKKTKNISAGLIPAAKKISRIEKILLWIRGNLFIPDARVFWVKPSVKKLLQIINDQNIQTVITSGPPHSLHLIGMALQKKANIRWIADFRDPWTTISYHQSLRLSDFARKKHLKLEQEVLEKADRIIVTSQVTKKEFLKKTRKPIHVITNGFDPVENNKFELDKNFSIAHIGTFLSERNPRIFWKTLKEICSENVNFKNDFRLKLVGRVSQEILDTIAEFRLEKHVDNLGYVAHQEAIRIQQSAQVLLLVEIDSPQTRCIIPGKLFEYMHSKRPILALGPDGSDVQTILTKTQSGTYFEYDQKEALKTQILALYEQFLQNNLKTEPVGLEKFTRKKLTKKLVKVLSLRF